MVCDDWRDLGLHRPRDPYADGHGGLARIISTTPVLRSPTLPFQTILTATSVAALTYGGFDGVTTLAEEVEIRGGT